MAAGPTPRAHHVEMLPPLTRSICTPHDSPAACAQPVFKSQYTGLLTYCVEYQTDRGVPFEKAQERLAKEVRRAADHCDLLVGAQACG